MPEFRWHDHSRFREIIDILYTYGKENPIPSALKLMTKLKTETFIAEGAGTVSTKQDLL